ncbi:hypothetical protein B0H10DRAFT_2231843 [Mycena sp. CBHHK59/15]|nr:hypothetical protein B0H10DRAFT_2231843 [Mycena sp. CBHHK59/15]
MSPITAAHVQCKMTLPLDAVKLPLHPLKLAPSLAPPSLSLSTLYSPVNSHRPGPMASPPSPERLARSRPSWNRTWTCATSGSETRKQQRSAEESEATVPDLPLAKKRMTAGLPDEDDEPPAKRRLAFEEDELPEGYPIDLPN